MAAKVEQNYKERATSIDRWGRYTGIEVPYIVFEAADEDAALTAVLNAVPKTLHNLPLDAIEIDSRDGDTTFKVGGRADVLLSVRSEEELKHAVLAARDAPQEQRRGKRERGKDPESDSERFHFEASFRITTCSVFLPSTLYVRASAPFLPITSTPEKTTSFTK